MPPKSTRTRGRGGRVDSEADRALIVTNPDPAKMSERPIQPELQPIPGSSSSNDDILVNDSRDDTDVWI